MPGPAIRSDIVDVYVFRRESTGARFLQMHRSAGALAGTWHPVMGHVMEGEAAPKTALRELAEETQLRPTGFWQLEQPNIYYLASHDCIVMGPCFAVEVEAHAEPTLNEEHDAHRWVGLDEVEGKFLWPGQRLAVAQIVRDILPADAPARGWMRLKVE